LVCSQSVKEQLQLRSLSESECKGTNFPDNDQTNEELFKRKMKEREEIGQKQGEKAKHLPRFKTIFCFIH
ncbi:MAG: hypothetical protein K2O61_03435, partial [Bacteroidaceae bacterium]|nr:hypothetical protein [Bacteroidaceae bacterium]